MKYRGHDIRDVEYITKHDTYKGFDENTVEWYYDDIKEMLDALSKKTQFLRDSGVNYKDVRISYTAVDEEYNSNGRDFDPYTVVDICWEEEETQEERERRIQREKKSIDVQIEIDERMEKAKKAVEEHELEKAIELIRKSGGTVKF